MNLNPDRIRPRRSAILTALVGAILASVLGGCAMASRAPDPAAAPGDGVTADRSYREHDSPKKLEINEPQTIAAWEARIQRQGATLYTLVHGAGGAASPPPPPSDPPSMGPTPTSPSPGTGPHRRPSVRRYPTRASRRATAGTSGGTTGGTSAKARQSIRCRRICRTVRAICYAARRICQIASRVGGQSAQAACRRNQKTCRSARTISTRQGCATCGYVQRSPQKQTRRACLN